MLLMQIFSMHNERYFWSEKWFLKVLQQAVGGYGDIDQTNQL